MNLQVGILFMSFLHYLNEQDINDATGSKDQVVAGLSDPCEMFFVCSATSIGSEGTVPCQLLLFWITQLHSINPVYFWLNFDLPEKHKHKKPPTSPTTKVAAMLCYLVVHCLRVLDSLCLSENVFTVYGQLIL